MRTTSNTPRKLHAGHFAFMRALAQGVDERASWDRYLRVEGEHSDLRTVRRTIAWIQDSFAAAAKRENKPGTARLLRLDPDRFTATPLAPAQPTLAEFALAQGMEDFSEAEQLEAYADAYPPVRKTAESRGGRGAPSRTRRGRVIWRQLEALQWLQDLVAQDPRPGDRVAAWLNPLLAGRLERAGLVTLFDLVEHMNGNGARWWVQVHGVGERKALRILEWLQAHEAVLGLRVGVHAARRRSELTSDSLHQVMPAATAIRPLEKFLVPSELDGAKGQFRAPIEKCLLGVDNDLAAVDAWLKSKCRGVGEAGVQLNATQRAYRREAERLLLWAILERKKPLSSLTVDDATAFTAFLKNPPAAWCGPRHRQRWSPLWRPLEGPMGPKGLRHAVDILRSLFSFLGRQGYMTGNPFTAVALPTQNQRILGVDRTLSFAQWDHIDAALGRRVDLEAGRRLRRGMRWLYATGLRLAEITRAKCGDLEQVAYRAADGARATDWRLHVAGRGGHARQVPVPHELVAELGEELARFGLGMGVTAPSNRDIHVMARFAADLDRPAAWSGSGLYQAIKKFFADAAGNLEAGEAAGMAKASTHWLRHSHAAHALQGREDLGPVAIRQLQRNLGHASIGTTAMYLTGQREARPRPAKPQRGSASSTDQGA